jgi:hypothetical protein
MACCAHKARSVFDVAIKRGADQRRAERRCKGGVLSGDPTTGIGRDIGNIEDLEVGGQCRGLHLDRDNTRSGDEASYMLEGTRDDRGGQDGRGSDKNTTTDVRSAF